MKIYYSRAGFALHRKLKNVPAVAANNTRNLIMKVLKNPTAERGTSVIFLTQLLSDRTGLRTCHLLVMWLTCKSMKIYYSRAGFALHRKLKNEPAAAANNTRNLIMKVLKNTTAERATSVISLALLPSDRTGFRTGHLLVMWFTCKSMKIYYSRAGFALHRKLKNEQAAVTNSTRNLIMKKRNNTTAALFPAIIYPNFIGPHV